MFVSFRDNYTYLLGTTSQIATRFIEPPPLAKADSHSVAPLDLKKLFRSIFSYLEICTTHSLNEQNKLANKLKYIDINLLNLTQ